MSAKSTDTVFAVPRDKPITISTTQLNRLREHAKNNKPSAEARETRATKVKMLFTKPEKCCANRK